MKKIVNLVIVLFSMFIPSAYGIKKIDIHENIIGFDYLQLFSVHYSYTIDRVTLTL